MAPATPGRDTTGLRTFRILDGLLMLLALVAAVLFVPMARGGAPETVTVYRDDVLVAQYPLDHDGTFRVRGQTGPVEITIADGAVRVSRSTCPRQICVRSGTISHARQEIICAPNHLTVSIRSPSERGDLDAVAR
jgi:hypothetical protein